MLVFIIAIWKRHDVTNICLNHLKQLQDKYGFEVVCCGSEQHSSRSLVSKYGFTYIEKENYPVSKKNNALLNKAKEFNPDGVVILGSDDLINDKVVEYYYKLIEQKTDKVHGFRDLYFFSTEHNYLSWFNVGLKSYGAGRFWSKSALNKVNWIGYPEPRNRGLDRNNKEWMEKHGVEFKSIDLKDIDGFLVDIKHQINISNKNIIFVGEKVSKELFYKYNFPIFSINKLVLSWKKNQKK
jgi:hypothetical protein